MRGAGPLQQLLAFDPPARVDDGYGGTTDGWGAAYTCSARIQYLRGGERVQAARLDGVQTVLITIRAGTTANTINPTWRARDLRSGATFNITAVEPTEDRGWLEIIATKGAPS